MTEPFDSIDLQIRNAVSSFLDARLSAVDAAIASGACYLPLRPANSA